MYTKKVIDHFTSPRNCGKIKKIDNVSKVGNPICGDTMTIYIKADKKDIIENIKKVNL